MSEMNVYGDLLDNIDETNSFLEKEKPYNIEIEESLLSSILIKPDSISDVADILSPRDFYKNSHKIIFELMLEIYEEGILIEIIVLIDRLKSKEKIDSIGGETVIYDLVDVVATAANVVNYAKMIKEYSMRRDLIEVGEEIVRIANRGYDPMDKILDKSESMIFKIAESKQKKDIVSLKELANLRLSQLRDMTMSKEHLRGIPTSFVDFDKITNGLHGSELLILAARPAMGKTAFALNLALQVAKNKKHVLVYSLEMGNEQLFARLLSIQSKIKMKYILNGSLYDDSLTKVTKALAELSELPLYISDSASANILEIKTVSRRLKAEGKLDFILIDYLQLISPSEGSRKNREQEISEISRSLKILAKELDVPIMALSQLSRSVELRQDKRPILSDLRESGAIEQDADMVTFLYRDSYYNNKNEENDEQNDSNNSSNSNKNIPPYLPQPKTKTEIKGGGELVELIIGKHRSGPTGTVNLIFQSDIQAFYNFKSENN